MRTFIAISLPEKLRMVIAEIQSELKSNRENRISWPKPHLSHLTLKFLGEVKENDIPKISKCLEDVAANFSPFSLHSTSPSGFPNMKLPKVIWLGVAGGVELINLRSAVEKKFSSIGFEEDTRTFHPHITIGRIKQLMRGTEMIKRLHSIRKSSIFWKVDEIRLISSQLRPTGAVYQTLTNAPFGES